MIITCTLITLAPITNIIIVIIILIRVQVPEHIIIINSTFFISLSFNVSS